MPCTPEQRLIDTATSEAELRRIWLLLGMSPEMVERAIELKNHERDGPERCGFVFAPGRARPKHGRRRRDLQT